MAARAALYQWGESMQFNRIRHMKHDPWRLRFALLPRRMDDGTLIWLAFYRARVYRLMDGSAMVSRKIRRQRPVR